MYCINDHSYDMLIVAAVGLLVVLFGKVMIKRIFLCGCFQLYCKLTKPLCSKSFVQHIDTVATAVTNRMVQNKGDMWEPLLVYYLVRSCDLVTGVDCGIS